MSLTAVDKLMERASRALEGTRYFEAERLCAQALERAHARHDFGRMSRILLPLLEARRQKRQLAVDAGPPRIVAARMDGRRRPTPGCCMLQPPLIAGDASVFRARANAARVPAFVLTREPMTQEGLWPIVGVSSGLPTGPPIAVRTKVTPPTKLRRRETAPSKDSCADGDRIPLAWFEAAGEALGDAAIASIDSGDHPAWRVDDLFGLLDACPDHEKLHQRLDDACREAMEANPPEGRRPSRLTDDAFSY